MISQEFGLKKYSESLDKLDIQASEKRNKKSTYAKSPLFLRSFLYFFYRYIARGAFLEGKEGFVWSFMQGWWYRTLVDANIFEVKMACGNDKEKIRNYLKEKYNIIIE